MKYQTAFHSSLAADPFPILSHQLLSYRVVLTESDINGYWDLMPYRHINETGRWSSLLTKIPRRCRTEHVEACNGPMLIQITHLCQCVLARNVVRP